MIRANKLGYDVALKIASYMAKETEFVPWESFFDSMDYIQSMLSETDSYGLLKVLFGFMKSKSVLGQGFFVNLTSELE